ncbi:hypothetical protein CCACVL1_21152 [Corchorus capsularis]|uniref:Uncharacterized protein n=1 Tax=Corchorus capsularis TaxID=210143 RepID=A0A1R3H7Z3_COCAP|nr:hypothetical protein CCACVL1_21152 [Corchorus capsularis]
MAWHVFHVTQSHSVVIFVVERDTF